MSFEIRPLTEDHIPAFRQAISAGFGHDAPDDEGAIARFHAIFELDRSYPAFDGDEIVGTGGDFGFEMTVPGGDQVATSGLTIITVRPTHTRRGMLTAMMREHFDRARERGEILGGLWASEVPIYGRYGYGWGVLRRGIRIDARLAGRGGSEPGVTVRLIESDTAEALLPKLYEQMLPTRPGTYRRSEAWWTHRLFYDPERHRDGGSAIRHALAEHDGEPVGYMSYRQKGDWDLLSEGEVRIRELIPLSDPGYRALWYYATNIDLFPIVKYWNNPVDDPVALLLRDGRAVATTDYGDSLWVRLIDVPAALQARRYEGQGCLVIGLTDSFCDWNEGTYRVAVDEGVASVERVATESDVSMDVASLGALYMGGRDAAAMARAGLIDGAADAIGRLNAMFRHSPAPWCPEIF